MASKNICSPNEIRIMTNRCVPTKKVMIYWSSGIIIFLAAVLFDFFYPQSMAKSVISTILFTISLIMIGLTLPDGEEIATAVGFLLIYVYYMIKIWVVCPCGDAVRITVETIAVILVLLSMTRKALRLKSASYRIKK